MLKGLKRLAAGGILLRELRGLRLEMQGIRTAVERLAAALETRNAHDYPQAVPAADPSLPAVEVSYVDAAEQEEWMQVELDLTAARGIAPTEDEVLAEWERRHQGGTPA